MDRTYFPGTRVMVFDARLFVDDKKTPTSHTIRPATVVRWYGQRGTHNREWLYPSLIDVVFDYRPGEESRAHFTSHVEMIKSSGPVWNYDWALEKVRAALDRHTVYYREPIMKVLEVQKSKVDRARALVMNYRQGRNFLPEWVDELIKILDSAEGT